MAYDSEATRRRLLDAAYAEFAERGLAGARVDRIAVDAGANKQAIYAYFGSKDSLFDAVLATRLGILADRVPFTPDDLPGYAGALFDHMITDPQLVRLTLWKALERNDATDLERDSHLTKAKDLADAMGVSDEAGMDTLMMVLAVSQSWSVTPSAIRGRGTQARIKRHRDAIVRSATAIQRALGASTPTSTG